MGGPGTMLTRNPRMRRWGVMGVLSVAGVRGFFRSRGLARMLLRGRAAGLRRASLPGPGGALLAGDMRALRVRRLAWRGRVHDPGGGTGTGRNFPRLAGRRDDERGGEQQRGGGQGERLHRKWTISARFSRKLRSDRKPGKRGVSHSMTRPRVLESRRVGKESARTSDGSAGFRARRCRVDGGEAGSGALSGLR